LHAITGFFVIQATAQAVHLASHKKDCKNNLGDDSQDFVIFLQARASAGELFEHPLDAPASEGCEFSRSTCK